MLKHLRKYLTSAPAENKEEDTHMAVEDKQPDLSAPVLDVTGDVASLTAAIATLTTELAASQGKVAELTAQVEAATEFKAAQEAMAVEAKSAARLAKLVSAVGQDKAVGLHAATVAVDDVAFEAVVSALQTSMKTEEKSPLFTEAGVDATADTALVVDTGARVMDYLKNMSPQDLNLAQ